MRPEKDITRQQNHRTISLIIIDVNILNKILVTKSKKI